MIYQELWKRQGRGASGREETGQEIVEIPERLDAETEVDILFIAGV